jgi:thioredoxin-like negative regulator of GroEL
MRFVKVNTEAERELSARFRIRSIPTIMMFKNGEVIDMLNGAVPKAPLIAGLTKPVTFRGTACAPFSPLRQWRFSLRSHD